MTKDNMLILALSGVLLMIVALPAGKGTEGKAAALSPPAGPSGESAAEAEGAGDRLPEEEALLAQADLLARRLEQFLSCMEGVGQARVMLTFSATQERVVEKDTPANRSRTEETDAAGGSRSVSSEQLEEDTVYTADGAGNQVPYVRKVLAARLEGVTVLARGADSMAVQKNITDVIQSLFGVEAHKIKVAKLGTVSE